MKSNNIRLIGSDGNQIGIVSKEEASRLAIKEGLDLVEMSPNANPPVVKMMDYGKYKFELSKKSKKEKKENIVKIKSIKFKLNINNNDIIIKVKKIDEFLSKGCKVKLHVILKGREIERKEFGFSILKNVFNYIKKSYKVESSPKLEGRDIISVIVPSEK